MQKGYNIKVISLWVMQPRLLASALSTDSAAETSSPERTHTPTDWGS